MSAMSERLKAGNNAMAAAVTDAIRRLELDGRPRVTRAVAHRILLKSPWFLNGTYYLIVGKSVGAGVWELRPEKESR